MTTYAKALELIDAGIANMEAAGDYPLKTRAALERYAASVFWRGVGALCQRDVGTAGGAINNPAVAHQTITRGSGSDGG